MLLERFELSSQNSQSCILTKLNYKLNFFEVIGLEPMLTWSKHVALPNLAILNGVNWN